MGSLVAWVSLLVIVVYIMILHQKILSVHCDDGSSSRQCAIAEFSCQISDSVNSKDYCLTCSRRKLESLFNSGLSDFLLFSDLYNYEAEQPVVIRNNALI